MGEASGARSVGWQPCRACRPLRGDELVGTRPVADEGGGPSAATSEAKRAWLAKQAVPSWRSRLPSPYPLALTRTLALALTLTLTLILSPQDAYPYLLRMPYPTPYPYLLRMPYPTPISSGCLTLPLSPQDTLPARRGGAWQAGCRRTARGR